MRNAACEYAERFKVLFFEKLFLELLTLGNVTADYNASYISVGSLVSLSGTFKPLSVTVLMLEPEY